MEENSRNSEKRNKTIFGVVLYSPMFNLIIGLCPESIPNKARSTAVDEAFREGKRVYSPSFAKLNTCPTQLL